MGIIDAYVADLDAALRGPRRAKADLLAEARDSLVDAAEAHHRRGLPRDRAELHAVDQFGAVSEIAADYQAELGMTQSRRTMLMITLVLIPQNLVWENRWRGEFYSPDHAGPGYAALSHLVVWLGGATIGLSVLAVLACGIGVRYLGVRRGLARVAGIFALTISVFFVLAGLALTLLAPTTASLLALSGLPWTVAFLVVPMAGVAISARRCLGAA